MRPGVLRSFWRQMWKVSFIGGPGTGVERRSRRGTQECVRHVDGISPMRKLGVWSATLITPS